MEIHLRIMEPDQYRLDKFIQRNWSFCSQTNLTNGLFYHLFFLFLKIHQPKEGLGE